MTLRILGTGTAVPPFSIAQEDAAVASLAIFPPAEPAVARTIAGIFRKTQVRRRGTAVLDRPEGEFPRQTFFPPATGRQDRGPGTAARMRKFAEVAPGLGLAACRGALAEADLPGDRITHLITIGCTGFVAPGIEHRLIRELGLPPTVARTQIGFMGCHGLFNGLRVAAAFAREPGSRVLVCAVELCSLHFQYSDALEHAVANSLFADGAGAVVCRDDADDTSPPTPWPRPAAFESFLFPDSAAAMGWTVTDHGFVMTLSPEVPSLIGAGLRPWLTGRLAAHGLSLADIGGWAIHPGGPKIVAAAGAALDLPADALADSLAVLADHGNMSSPTILFVLRRLLARDCPRPWVALGFGPGLVVEGMLWM